ncbi:16S rRNA (adenine(1518)-N(6)/adenine(1519)-N(6))-dimethyltransferase RsmA [Nakamurella aerolata]|uniref:Ribosomal RNA small subunit methyltransferase A n=1 Tax=Nakamurella aerolata TaxID=1656892 RepID=A0A849A9N1_9ACTN|nr:16S rRNA (adenine(1518)-N(6)/adenine(1519)-N(6))-dimethyltransferase RsmA [Nakamurella aerolata]NNG35801.1 16S rRNA (adenine(1518)-N(6)/adenine(1519)-N(6))-dimethyltransferase RsmA [Nakamurella aerolata]
MEPVSAQPTLLGAAEIRRLVAELGLRPTKTLGQNFVIDGNTVRRIVQTAALDGHSHVLEVGPGLGSLTLGLLAAGKRVTAVEIDPRLAELLPRTAAEHGFSTGLSVIPADALRLTAADLPGPDDPPTALVANLPYNVAVPVLLHLLATLPSLRRVLVMVQAEVADRLAAPPGSKTYGAPSVKAAWYGPTRRAGSIARSVFWPVPGVDSALVGLDHTDAFAGADQPPAAEVFAVVDAAFAQRRKTLRSALAGWAGSATAAEQLLRTAGVDPGARGEVLDVAGFVAIADAARRAEATNGRADQ